MSFKAQTSRQRNGPFESSNLVFETHDEAMSYAERSADLSTLIADYRVIPSEDRPTHRFVSGRLQVIPWELTVS